MVHDWLLTLARVGLKKALAPILTSITWSVTQSAVTGSAVCDFLLHSPQVSAAPTLRYGS